MENYSIERLMGIPFGQAQQELARFAPDSRQKRGIDTLNLPAVNAFRAAYSEQIRRAEALARIIGGVARAYAVDQVNSQTRPHSLNIEEGNVLEAICTEHDHPIPHTVAMAALGDEDLKNPEIRLADLTNSYFLEDIRNGKLFCEAHPLSETGLVRIGSVIRIIPESHASPEEIEQSVISKITEMLYPTLTSGQKFENFRRDVDAALQLFFRIGSEPHHVYERLFDGMRQTRHRAITAAYIAKGAIGLERLPVSVRRLSDYEKARAEQTPAGIAEAFSESKFFKAIDKATTCIPSPELVIRQRTKGQTLVEKVLIARHWPELKAAHESGELEAHFERLAEHYNSDAFEIPEELREEPPNIADLVAMDLITHDDHVNYSWHGLASGSFKLKDSVKRRLGRKMAELLRAMAGLQEGTALQGICETKSGLVFAFDPEYNMFDDYVAAQKASGYIGYHATVESGNYRHRGAVVEIRIKPNVMVNLERFGPDESHEKYKTRSAAYLHFLMHNSHVTPTELNAAIYLLTPTGMPYAAPNIQNLRLPKANAAT